MIQVKDLKLNDANPRFIRDERFQKLKDSIEQFPKMMNLRPIVVDAAGVVLGGNMRLRALIDLGYKSIPKAWVKKADELTEEEKRRFIIADNTGFGEWDWDLLANEWDSAELETWGMELPDEWGAEEPEAQEDGYEMPDEIETDVKEGDLIEIGPHRLLCGDSTKAEDVDRLMDGKKADLCLTDPPYGIGDTESVKNNYSKHEDTKENLDKIIRGFIPIAKKVSKIQVLTPGTTWHRLYPDPNWTMAWFVPAGTGIGPWGFCCWQPILCYGKDPKLSKGKGSHPDAIVHTEAAEKNGHPCPKPVNFWQWLMKRTSEEQELVYDPFLGSGTTMVAAHQLNRICYGMEIDPKYCQVIIYRMHKLDPSLEIKINGKKYEPKVKEFA